MASIALSAPTSAPSRAGNRVRFALAGLGTIVAAVVANVLVYALGSQIVGYDPEFVILANASGTIIFTVFPAIVAVLLYAALVRFTRRPERNFTVISAIVLVVSLVPDVTYIPTVPGATAGQTAILMLMHVVAATVIVGLLTNVARPKAR
jgi:hypothetical protein